MNYLSSQYSLDELRRDLAWSKAAPVPGYSPIHVRQDCDGRIIVRHEHGNRSDFGWEIDHAVPKVLGGSDHPSNLRARHWLGNSSAGGLLGAALRGRR